jgi:hypothetical protein
MNQYESYKLFVCLAKFKAMNLGIDIKPISSFLG